MIQTLHIISVGVAILAGLVLASVLGPVPLISLGASDDQQVITVLDSPGAVERFKDRQGGKASDGQDKTSPLVRQAEAFSEIINPTIRAEAPTGRTTIQTPRPSVPAPRKSSTKFDVIGMSYSASNPQASFAYIRLPDKTERWVQRGSQVGHWVVKEITASSIVCWDGQRSVEEMVTPLPDTAGLLEAGGSGSAASAVGTTQPGVGRTEVRPANRPSMAPRPAATAGPLPSKVTAEEEGNLRELVARLRDLQKDARTGSGGAAVSPEERAEMMNRLISEFKSSSRVSDEEAGKLEDLGKQLNGEKESMSERRRDYMRRLGNRPDTR